MFRNTLRTRAIELPNPQLNSTPRPGDYELGSEESRAAARALFDAKAAEALRNKYRVVVECIGRPINQLDRTRVRPTCQRYL